MPFQPAKRILLQCWALLRRWLCWLTRAPRNPMYPGIASQYSGYLKQQLKLFTAGKRGGSAYAHVMHSAAAFRQAAPAVSR